MTKPNPIALIALCIVALSILAFTINDQFGQKKDKPHTGTINTTNSSLFLTHNPPHGQPGHNHDLPDGAPLQPISSTPAAPQYSSAAINNITQPGSDNSTVAVNPPHGQPGHNCAIAVGAPLTTSSNAVATATATSGNNPPHGQPGHRCDIAVGAPLNSAPVKPVTAANSTAATNANVAAPANGLNPSHGQPGHRCDIAVGAPLNSPVKSNSTPVVANNKPATSPFPSYNFGQTDSSAATAITPQFQYDSTGAALNPPHGQPGHDCAIAVGKPLKK